MASPIIYDAFSDGTDGLGIGVLSDAISCVVTEELNGLFELHMTYPVKGILFEEVMMNRLIKVDTGHQLKEQLFRIEKIETTMSDIAMIYAPHVTSIIRHIPTRERGWNSGDGVGSDIGTFLMEAWNDTQLIPSPFTVSSDFTFGEAFFAENFSTTNAQDGLRAILEGWGGDFIFNNYHIHYAPLGRGWNSGEIISYGKNLVGFTKDENMVDVFTGVLPTARHNNELIQGEIVRSSNADSFPYTKIKTVDFSSLFRRDERPTINRLKQLAQEYIRLNLNTTPNVSIEIDFVENTSINEHGSRIEALNLGDTLKVYFEHSKKFEEARVVRVEWDVLMERYKKLEVGTISQRFRDGIKRITRGGN